MVDLNIHVWHATGTFYLVDNYGESTNLGYVRDNIEPIITYTTPIDNHVPGVYTFFPNGVPIKNQQVEVFRLYLGLNYPNKGLDLSMVK